MRKHIVLVRLQQSKKQTLGKLIVFNGLKQVFNCKTLELPDLQNQRNTSRIPEGEYEVKLRISEKYGSHFHLQDVPNRSFILIHAGNYHTQTAGCILVGRKYHDINRDGLLDVTTSRNTMIELMDIMPHEFSLRIIDVEH